jgi:hypothetical protein
VLANSNTDVNIPASWHVALVQPELSPGSAGLVKADVLDRSRPTRHDPAKLACAVMALLRANGRGRTAA